MRNLILAAIGIILPGTAGAAPVTYNGSQSTVQYNVPTTSGFGYTGTQYINGTKVIYDAATDSYTLRDTGSPTKTSTFTAANITSSTTDYTTYTKTSGGVTETFKVLNQDPANSVIVLNYVTYGKWRRTGLSGAYPNNDTYVVFGTKTARAAMPVSGTGNYSTVLDGTWLDKNGVYSVSGTGNVVANFATGSLTYDATATGTRESGGSTIAFGTMTGTGSIANGGPAFSGTGGFNANGYAMNINGNFYGPAADEIGGNFILRGNIAHRGSGTGAFVGN